MTVTIEKFYSSFILKCCFSFSEESQDKCCCIQSGEGNKEKCDGNNGADVEERKRWLDTASGATRETEQVYLRLPPLYPVYPRVRTSGKTQRMAVCSGTETAAILQERTRARVLIKKFGELTLSDTETSSNLK